MTPKVKVLKYVFVLVGFISFSSNACFPFDSKCLEFELNKNINHEFSCVPFDDKCREFKVIQEKQKEKLANIKHKRKAKEKELVALRNWSDENKLLFKVEYERMDLSYLDIPKLHYKFINNTNKVINYFEYKVTFYDKNNHVVFIHTGDIWNQNIYPNSNPVKAKLDLHLKPNIFYLKKYTDRMETLHFEITKIRDSLDNYTHISKYDEIW